MVMLTAVCVYQGIVIRLSQFKENSLKMGGNQSQVSQVDEICSKMQMQNIMVVGEGLLGKKLKMKEKF